MKTFRTALFAATALSLASTAAVRAQDAAPAASDAQVSEVVVTAQKRSESIQRVPISMTALSERRLEREHITSLQDLARIAPSLTVVSAGPGENNLIIRGISSIAGSTATVGYYLDDTPVMASSNAALLSTRGVIDPAVFDVARIEVLRGPQGTLYGSSSMGGTIRYITNQPDLENFGGKLRTEASDTRYGGFNWNVNGVVNVPIVKDKVAARVAAYYRHDDGYIDQYRIDPDNYLAVDPNGGKKKNVNTYETYGARASVLIKPDDTLTITPSFIYQSSRLGAPFTYDKVPASLHDFYQVRDVNERNLETSWIANLSVHKKVEDVDLMSSTSYFHRDVKLRDDSSKVMSAFFPGQITSVYPTTMYGTYKNKEFTEEVRATTNFSGPFQSIVGAFYHNVHAPLNSGIPFPEGYDSAFNTPFPGYSTIYSGVRRAQLEEFAMFTELSYQILPTLTARVGARAFEVDQKFYQSGDGVLNGGFSEVTNKSSDSGITPKFTLQWQATPDAMIYGTVSKGYRPGGPNNPAPADVCGASVAGLGLSNSQLTRYGPDHLWNYEIGAKTSWLDRRLTVNGSLFWIDWDAVQQQIVLDCGFNITANFGKARSRGGEIETEFRPIPSLLLTAGAGYTDAYLRNDVPGTAAQKGDQLQDVPHWNVNGSAEYTHQINDVFSGYGRVDVSYVSSSDFLYDETSPFYRRKGFMTTNLRFGVDHRDDWEASVFVTNLFDKQGETALPVAISADLSNTRRVALNQPRTVGVTLQYKY